LAVWQKEIREVKFGRIENKGIKAEIFSEFLPSSHFYLRLKLSLK
jgi:hypothetical protein